MRDACSLKILVLNLKISNEILAINNDDSLVVMSIGFLFQPVANPFTRMRLGRVTRNHMQMRVEYCLPSYRPAVPTQIVALRVVFGVKKCFNLCKK